MAAWRHGLKLKSHTNATEGFHPVEKIAVKRKGPWIPWSLICSYSVWHYIVIQFGFKDDVVWLPKCDRENSEHWPSNWFQRIRDKCVWKVLEVGFRKRVERHGKTQGCSNETDLPQVAVCIKPTIVIHAWWLVWLFKWFITPVINGLTRLIPLIEESLEVKFPTCGQMRQQ